VQQFERDREMLQQGINKLEQDLDDARKAQDTLDDQKQENVSNFPLSTEMCERSCQFVQLFSAPPQGDY